jgi:UTP--glucose-1-phosphate uridylyltransferase
VFAGMNIRKAVITAAGREQRSLPLQVVVDSDGVEKSALQVLVEEALSAGVDEVAVILAPGDQSSYAQAAGRTAAHLHFIEQTQPRGYGHALGLAAPFVGSEPFLHLISDHLYLGGAGKPRCAQQVVAQAGAHGCSVSAVQPTREAMLPFYGTVGGRRVPRQPGLYEIENVLEKPSPNVAEQHLFVPGLRAGHYLCFFGIHVFTAAVMGLLQQATAATGANELIALSPILAQLAAQERYLAVQVQGRRFNIGVKYGLFMAQLALALEGQDRDNVLAQMVELLALR